MIEFAEGVATFGALIVAAKLVDRWRKPERLPEAVLSRKLYDGEGDFKCPECRQRILVRNNAIGKRCTCEEFWEPHRHFACRCGLEGIIQTIRSLR